MVILSIYCFRGTGDRQHGLPMKTVLSVECGGHQGTLSIDQLLSKDPHFSHKQASLYISYLTYLLI